MQAKAIPLQGSMPARRQRVGRRQHHGPCQAPASAVQRRRRRSRRARQRSPTPGSLGLRRALHRANEGGAVAVLHLGRVRPASVGSMPEVDMNRSARLFLCARCRDQVLLCSHCDHGQQYCSRACSSASRRERRREAAVRYQSSRRGRRRHAVRTACWRRQRRSLRQPGTLGDTDKVTHQGCPDRGGQASLLACDTPNACESVVLIESVHDTAPIVAGAVPFAARVCRRSAQPLLPHVRGGYLRPRSVRWRRAHGKHWVNPYQG